MLHTQAMVFSKKEKYQLDVHGVCFKKGFLSLQDVDLANRIIDDHLEKALYQPYKFNFFELDKIFCRIMSDEWVVSACRQLLGDQFRFDHCMGIQQPGSVLGKNGNLASMNNGNLHGGTLTNQGSVFYLNHGNQTLVGQLGLGISLSGQNSDSGGFCYIAGSHKQGSEWGKGSDVFSKTLNCFDQSVVEVPVLNKGDAFIFVDNIVHGTTHLKAEFKRRALYYKFSPGFAAWRPHTEIAHYIQFAENDLQRKMLRPPFVASFDGDVEYSDNRWRTDT